MQRHQAGDLGEERLHDSLSLGDRLEDDSRLGPVRLGAAHHRREDLVAVADQEQARGDAHDRPVSDLDRDVLPRPSLPDEGDIAAVVRLLRELREPHVPAVLGRQADVLVRATLLRQVGVERDLQVRAFPRRDLLRDDGQLRGIAAQVLAQPHAEPGLLDWCVRHRPGVEVAERLGEILGCHRLGQRPAGTATV